jgi:hypothetical protein
MPSIDLTGKVCGQGTSEELSQVMRTVLTSGGSASLITLTMRHHAGHKLKDLWQALSAAWRGVISGKQWIADQELGGLLGWVRVVEATHGRNGWHLHVHAWSVGIDRSL